MKRVVTFIAASELYWKMFYVFFKDLKLTVLKDPEGSTWICAKNRATFTAHYLSVDRVAANHLKMKHTVDTRICLITRQIFMELTV